MATGRTRKQAEQHEKAVLPVSSEASTLESEAPCSMAEMFQQMELSRQADKEDRRAERTAAQADLARAEFERRAWQEGLSAIEVVLQLSAIEQSWTEEKVTRAELADHFVMERFIESQLPPLQRWVRERHPKSADHAATLAMDYADDRIPSTSNPGRPRDSRPGDSYRTPYGQRRPYAKLEPEPPKTDPSPSRDPTKPSPRAAWDKEKGPRC